MILHERLWLERAACRDEDPEIFWEASTDGFLHERLAKRICAECPVIDRCRADVDEFERSTPFAHWFGIWAGETPKERRKRRRHGKSNVLHFRGPVQRAVAEMEEAGELDAYRTGEWLGSPR